MDANLTPVEQKRLKDLEEAFDLFNQTSTQLTFAYDALSDQVTELQARLAETDQEKRRVAERLEQLLNLLPAGVIVLDSDGMIVELNPSAELILGKDAINRLWSVVIDNVFLIQNRAGELVTHDKVTYQLASSPLSMAQTENELPNVGEILLIQDVSAAKDLQTHVARHQRLDSLGDMAASLAHQIRTPLSSAILYTSQMSGKLLSQEQQQKSVSKSLKSLKHLESLVTDMLQYTKGGKIHDSVISISSLFAALQHSSEVHKYTEQVQFLFQPGQVESYVLGDQDALLTALQNLIDNAVLACKKNHKGRFVIDVSVNRISSGRIDLVVTDSGPGLAESLQEKVFEPFYTNRAQGTGLGLAVVRAVAEAHHGEAWVRSIEGNGASFGIRLPLYNQEEIA